MTPFRADQYPLEIRYSWQNLKVPVLLWFVFSVCALFVDGGFIIVIPAAFLAIYWIWSTFQWKLMLNEHGIYYCNYRNIPRKQELAWTHVDSYNLQFETRNTRRRSIHAEPDEQISALITPLSMMENKLSFYDKAGNELLTFVLESVPRIKRDAVREFITSKLGEANETILSN